MPLYFEGITSSSIRPSIFFFQPLIYLECHRTDLDHIQHAIKARPPVRLTRIWIFLAAFRPAVAQLAVSIRSQETTGCAFCLVSVFLITFQQIFFNKLIFCKPHIFGEIFFRDTAPVHLAAVSASTAVISCKQLFAQPVELLIQFFFICISFQENAKFIIFVSLFLRFKFYLSGCDHFQSPFPFSARLSLFLKPCFPHFIHHGRPSVIHCTPVLRNLRRFLFSSRISSDLFQIFH